VREVNFQVLHVAARQRSPGHSDSIVSHRCEATTLKRLSDEGTARWAFQLFPLWRSCAPP
jgi:hypothetical protein